MDESFSVKVSGVTKVYNGNAVLESISFEAKKGETIGIIGPNGAGKSTLLKILSGIVRPTAGTVVINGSVASILEIGMGFHPDLTGIENVFFAGQFMGFTKAQIKEKLPEIIAFSELEGHMNKLVKFYSSGMYMRLAFSIFALLDTDVLILDEVLSVGDASFRRKCFDLMMDYKLKEKSILLVSHNLNEIENFCDRIMYIDKKMLKQSSNIRSVILDYMRDYPAELKVIDSNWNLMNSSKPAVIPGVEVEKAQLFEHSDFLVLSVKLLSDEGVETNSFSYGDSISFNVKYQKLKRGVSPAFIWKLFDVNEILVFASSPMFSASYRPNHVDELGLFIEQTTLPELFLNEGRYYLTLVCTVDKSVKVTLHRLMIFDVHQNEWVKIEPWANISAPIIHDFPMIISKC